MKKQEGYVIARSRTASTFFTSSSAFDRPQWVSLKEASIYPTADIAQQAAKRLWAYGAYSADIISLKEMFDDPAADEPTLDDLPADDLSSEDDLGAEAPVDSAYGEPEGDDIAAMDTGETCPECGEDPCVCDDNGEPCPECGEVPCVCDGDESAYGADGETEGGDIAAMDTDEVDLENPDGSVSMSFEMPDEEDPLKKRTTESVLTELSSKTLTSYIKKATKSAKDLIAADDKVKGVKRGKNVVWASQKVKEREEAITESTTAKQISFKDPVSSSTKPDADLSHATSLPHEDKVAVPAALKSSLKSVITAFSKEAEEKNGRDDTRASFCLTVADALQQLHDDLSDGTSEGIKMAQIHMTSYMSPITQHIPSEVITFITRGGRKSTLKDLFSGIKESKRVDFDSMADQYQNKRG
jgi:hypothetical protein